MKRYSSLRLVIVGHYLFDSYNKLLFVISQVLHGSALIHLSNRIAHIVVIPKTNLVYPAYFAVILFREHDCLHLGF